MLINDEEVLLSKLNQLFGIKHNVFSRVKMAKWKMYVQASTYGAKALKIFEEENIKSWHLRADGNIKYKTLSNIVKGKISFNTLGNHLHYS
jgi:hypothetical protein